MILDASIQTNFLTSWEFFPDSAKEIAKRWEGWPTVVVPVSTHDEGPFR